ncbi:MAG TPA: heme o synthase [Candidatus Paceibacterota bacterium]|nr:heme o synthase [Candidatus Paceibacterota bacterium]
MNSTKLRVYYRLAKPGIIYGNLLTAAAAFAFAVHNQTHAPLSTGLLLLFAATMIGLGLSIAAGCVVNNVIERDIDARMERTKNRALPLKEITVKAALVYACLLGIAGFATLYFFTNTYALLATLFGVVVYIAVYTPSKQLTAHSTILGAFAGAVPPVVGYVAVTPALDANVLLLFLILMCWQMPHFFAISLYRTDEYRNAGLPVMPLRIGRFMTQVLMTLHAVLFAIAIFIFGILNQLSFFYFIPMAAVSLMWIFFSLAGFWAKDTARWARRTFLFSLIVLLLFSAVLALV